MSILLPILQRARIESELGGELRLRQSRAGADRFDIDVSRDLKPLDRELLLAPEIRRRFMQSVDDVSGQRRQLNLP